MTWMATRLAVQSKGGNVDSLMKKEKFIASETIFTEKGSFIYELHNDRFFNKVKLELLLSECLSLSILYKNLGKSERYNEILKGISSTFQHILFLVSCHFMPDDDFIIKNYDIELSSEIISDYYVRFRLILNSLII